MQALKTQITEKKVIEAQRQLLALAGVQGVAIQPAHQSDISLPTDRKPDNYAGNVIVWNII